MMSIFSLVTKKDIEDCTQRIHVETTNQTQTIISSVHNELASLHQDIIHYVQAELASSTQPVISSIQAELANSTQAIISAIHADTKNLRQDIIQHIHAELANITHTIISTILSEVQVRQEGVIQEIQQGSLLTLLNAIFKRIDDIGSVVVQLLPPDVKGMSIDEWYKLYMQRMLAFSSVVKELSDTKQETDKVFCDVDKFMANALNDVYKVMGDFLPREQATDPMRKIILEEEEPPQPV